jgi:hypothetical protein
MTEKKNYELKHTIIEYYCEQGLISKKERDKFIDEVERLFSYIIMAEFRKRKQWGGVFRNLVRVMAQHPIKTLEFYKKRENVVIKLGFCVAYDWLLLKKSVPLVYDWADTICFSLDKNRRSWSGTPFAFEENEFYEWVQHIDKDKKIKIYEDAFYREGFTSIENDNYQRTKMAEQMGRGGWHVQIDSDEYFLDFEGFKKYLFSVIENPGGEEKPLNICCSWINLIKRTDTGYLYVYHPTHNNSWMPFATNKPEYLEARRNSHFNHFSPFVVLHETWARGEAELWQKMNSIIIII